MYCLWLVQKKKLLLVYEALHSLAVCFFSLNQAHLLGYLAWLFWLFQGLNPNDGEARFECILSYRQQITFSFNFLGHEGAEGKNWGREGGMKAT